MLTFYILKNLVRKYLNKIEYLNLLHKLKL